jgi:uncharacterized membrane protein (DUF2068 family)
VTDNTKPHRDKILILIALGKLLKGLALMAVGLKVLSFLHQDVSALLADWIDTLQGSSREYIEKFVSQLGVLSDMKLVLFSLIFFAYAAIFFVAGVGLLLRKMWAEYFTIVITGSFIPFEIYEVWIGVNWLKALFLAGNIFVVIYLFWHIRRRRKARQIMAILASPAGSE